MSERGDINKETIESESDKKEFTNTVQKRVMDEKDTHDSKKVKSENTNKNTDVLSRITKYFKDSFKYQKALSLYLRYIQQAQFSKENSSILYQSLLDCFSDPTLYILQHNIQNGLKVLEVFKNNSQFFEEDQNRHISTLHYCIDFLSNINTDDVFDYDKQISTLKQKVMQLEKKNRKEEEEESFVINKEEYFYEEILLLCIEQCLIQATLEWRRAGIYNIVHELSKNRELLYKDLLPRYNEVYDRYMKMKNPTKKETTIITEDVARNKMCYNLVQKKIGSGLNV